MARLPPGRGIRFEAAAVRVVQITKLFNDLNHPPYLQGVARLDLHSECTRLFGTHTRPLTLLAVEKTP